MIEKILICLCTAVLLAGAVVVFSALYPCCQEDESGVTTCYLVGASWTSKVPGVCLQFTCDATGNITTQGCVESIMDCSGDNVCYQIGLYRLPFPYCCVQYACYSASSL